MSLAPGLVDIGSFIDQREGYRARSAIHRGHGRDGGSHLGPVPDRRIHPEQIAEEMRLTLPQVHAALSFYLANKERMNQEIEESDRLLEEEAEAHYSKFGRTRLSGDTSLAR